MSRGIIQKLQIINTGYHLWISTGWGVKPCKCWPGWVGSRFQHYHDTPVKDSHSHTLNHRTQHWNSTKFLNCSVTLTGIRYQRCPQMLKICKYLLVSFTTCSLAESHKSSPHFSAMRQINLLKHHVNVKRCLKSELCEREIHNHKMPEELTCTKQEYITIRCLKNWHTKQEYLNNRSLKNWFIQNRNT